MALKKREKVVIIFCALVVVSFIAYNFIYKPAFPKSQQLDKQIKEKEEKYVRVEQAVKDREKLEAYIKEINRRLEEVKRELPREDEIERLLRNLGEKCKDVGISYPSIRPQALVHLGDYKELPIQVDISECTTFQLYGFLDRLEDLRRLLDLKKFVISSGKEKLDAHFLLSTFIYVEGGEAIK